MSYETHDCKICNTKDSIKCNHYDDSPLRKVNHITRGVCNNCGHCVTFKVVPLDEALEFMEKGNETHWFWGKVVANSKNKEHKHV